MTEPTNTPADVLKSMVDHPAGRGLAHGERPGDWRPPARPGALGDLDLYTGRHRRSVTMPPAVSCHGPAAHGTVGAAHPANDTAPGESTVFELIGLTAALIVAVGAVYIAGHAGAALAGPVGALVASLSSLALILHTLRKI